VEKIHGGRVAYSIKLKYFNPSLPDVNAAIIFPLNVGFLELDSSGIRFVWN
jgi:hypothetical protein